MKDITEEFKSEAVEGPVVKLARCMQGSRVNDISLITYSGVINEEKIFWPFNIRPGGMGGGGFYHATYEALGKMLDVAGGSKLSLTSKQRRLTSDTGKAIIVDTDGEDNLFELEATADSWKMKSLQIHSNFGDEVVWKKSDLTPGQNKVLSFLLGAMQSEQEVSLMAYRHMLVLKARDVEMYKELAAKDPKSAEIIRRFEAYEIEIEELTGRRGAAR